MRRLVLLATLLVLTVAFTVAYATYRREVEYHRSLDAGQQALDRGETSAAIEAFSGAVALRPDGMAGWYKRGETYRLRGDLNSAVRDLRQATTIDPAATRPLELLGDVLFALERYPRAADAYERYLALDDRSPRVLYKAALSRFREGRLEAAESALAAALRQQERLPEAHYLLAVCRAQRGSTAEAIAALRKATEQAPAMVEARDLLATLYRRTGRPRDEARQLEALAALDPDRAERYVALALAYARQGRRDLAVATLGRAAREFPNAAAPFVALGRVWLDAQRDEPEDVVRRKAVEALTRAVALEPSSEALALLGEAQLAAGAVRDARAILERAVATLPVEDRAFTLLADAAERSGQPHGARDALVRAAALAGDADPRTAGRRALRIALLSTRVQDEPAAALWFDRALAMATDQDPVAQARRQWKAGDREGASTTLARAFARRTAESAGTRGGAR